MIRSLIMIVISVVFSVGCVSHKKAALFDVHDKPSIVVTNPSLFEINDVMFKPVTNASVQRFIQTYNLTLSKEITTKWFNISRFRPVTTQVEKYYDTTNWPVRVLIEERPGHEPSVGEVVLYIRTYNRCKPVYRGRLPSGITVNDSPEEVKKKIDHTYQDVDINGNGSINSEGILCRGYTITFQWGKIEYVKIGDKFTDEAL